VTQKNRETGQGVSRLERERRRKIGQGRSKAPKEGGGYLKGHARAGGIWSVITKGTGGGGTKLKPSGRCLGKPAAIQDNLQRRGVRPSNNSGAYSTPNRKGRAGGREGGKGKRKGEAAGLGDVLVGGKGAIGFLRRWGTFFNRKEAQE